MMKRYASALIGCGKMGAGYDVGRPVPYPPYSHAAALTYHPHFELVAVADPDEDSRHACAGRWGVPYDYAEAEKLFRAHPIEVAIIATPSSVRLAPIMAALAGGVRAIVCEKPLALGQAEALQIIEACAARGVTLVVNFTRRWDVGADQAAALCRQWGGVAYARGLYVDGIANNGAHLLDLLAWWTGEELTPERIEQVRGLTADSPHVLLSLAGGGQAELHPYADYDIFELDVFCPQGRLRLSQSGYRIEAQALVPATPLTGRPALGPIDILPSSLDFALLNMLDDLSLCLQTGAQPRCGAEDGLRVSRLLETIREVKA
jgi:predicted dehydrogenase